jgi:hypothetical protein
MICKLAEDAGDVANASGVGGRKLNDATNALGGAWTKVSRKRSAT